MRFGETVNPNLLRVLAEPHQLVIENPTAVDFWFQEGFLDDSQKKAVRRALATRDMFLNQGPPGTGKTSVIAELVLQILQRQEQARLGCARAQELFDLIKVGESKDRKSRKDRDAPPRVFTDYIVTPIYEIKAATPEGVEAIEML